MKPRVLNGHTLDGNGHLSISRMMTINRMFGWPDLQQLNRVSFCHPSLSIALASKFGKAQKAPLQAVWAEDMRIRLLIKFVTSSPFYLKRFNFLIQR